MSLDPNDNSIVLQVVQLEPEYHILFDKQKSYTQN